MKNLKLLFLFLPIFFLQNQSNAQLQVRNDAFIQIGYEDYRTLSFGIESASPNNGKYAIEHIDTEVSGGLNFWKPWPTPSFGNYVLFLRDDKKVGIGTTGSSNFKLDVSGRCRAWSWGTWSDKRFKSDIEPLTSSLEKIIQLQGVSYRYNFEFSKYTAGDISQLSQLSEAKAQTISGDATVASEEAKRIGFIAQEVQEIVPEAVIEDENGMLSINYDEIIPLLVEAIKEQQEKISLLENKVNTVSTAALRNGNPESLSTEMGSSLLYNNIPNPFKERTVIPYNLDRSSAGFENQIFIYNTNGERIESYQLSNKIGLGEVSVLNKNLANGIYVYTLVSNGQVVDSKTMIVSK